MQTTTQPAADVWAAHYASPQGHRYWPSEELVRFAGRRGGWLGDRVLEVGCGNGANLWFLAEHAGRVEGLDLSRQALDAAVSYLARRDCPDVTLTHGRALPLPYPAASFDGVCDLMVSQHVPWHDHAALYREYRRVLRPGGWLFLYHLDRGTTGGGGDRNDHERLDLFPAAGPTCLPHPGALGFVVRSAGFDVGQRRGLAVEYGDGTVAHYTVLEATAHD